MDRALIPLTAPGRQLAWLMNLEADPSAEEIADHLEPAAVGEVQADPPGRAMVRRAALARPAGRFAVHDYHQPFLARWQLADVTAALGCLEFCSDLARVARNLAAATKPGGRLLVTVPRREPVSPRREIILRPLPSLEITVRLRENAEVEAALAAAGLDVIAHDVGPGFTSPGIGTVEYGYWELKAPSANAEIPRAPSPTSEFTKGQSLWNALCRRTAAQGTRQNLRRDPSRRSPTAGAG